MKTAETILSNRDYDVHYYSNSAKIEIITAMKEYALEAIKEDRKKVAEHLWVLADKDSVINAPMIELK